MENKINSNQDNLLSGSSETERTVKDSVSDTLNSPTLDSPIFRKPSAIFTSFLEAVPDAMVVVNDRGKILGINLRAEQLFGYSRPELLGKSLEILVPDRFKETHSYHRENYQGSPRSRPMGLGMELWAQRKDGTELPVEISLQPLETPQGMWTLAAVRDVTERHQIQERLRAAQAELELKVAERTRELIAANEALRQEIEHRSTAEREVLKISEREQQRIGQDLHDNLGQTLTAVTYIGQLLQKKLSAKESVNPADAGEIVKLVSGAIDQVRQLARGLYPVELQTHGLVPALQELAAGVEAKYAVRCEVRHEDWDIRTDELPLAIQLYRISQEAVTNALKHASPKKIVLRLYSQRDSMSLSVEDDGRGIPQEKTTREGQRLGMGLHIMRYRATAIHAIFRIEPRKEGGTRIVCEWPRGGEQL